MKKNMNTDFNLKNVNEEVELYGWVLKKRNLGGLIFIDFRDKSGIIQLVVKPENEVYSVALSLKNEYVVKVKGIIKERESKNLNIPTGEIEVEVSTLEILNTSSELPFELTENTTASEETRLKYRYLDFRRNDIKNNLTIRHKMNMAIRNYLSKEGFLEIETPILCKSTPEGARDYLVPSRISKGKFYALPQSPQLFKQLLMIGGMEKYFQIARCFRDEDLRADRQPEFTQLDVEMSFVDEEDVMHMAEGVIKEVFKEVKDIDIILPLMKMKYVDAIKDYGSDKPDLRFDMKINDVTNVFNDTEFSLFKDVVSHEGIINCIVVKNVADKYSRKDLDKLTDYVKTYKATGLFFLKFNEDVTGSIIKNISDEELNLLKKDLAIENNDMVLLIIGKEPVVKIALGALRCKLAHDLGLIKENDYKLLWVVDFPSFEYSEEEKRFVACHHPFTAPKDEDIDKLLTDKANCYSKAYDIIINGYEAGGGSIRIHNQETQEKMFEALELTKDQINNKFGYFVSALKYGTPPHGGIAFGLDRLTMILANTDSIKDVIAFPKTASATDLMCEAPNNVDSNQLKDLHIQISKE